MEKEKIVEILRRCREEFEGDKFPEGMSEPHSPEEAAQVFADLAAQLGYDLKAEEILEVMETEKKKQKEQTEKTASEVECLTDDEVDAAGGELGCEYLTPQINQDDLACLDTYLDKENCMSSDGCDKNVNYYVYYNCHKNDEGAFCNLFWRL